MCLDPSPERRIKSIIQQENRGNRSGAGRQSRNADAIEPNRRILIEWSSGSEPPTTVEWTFAARPDQTTVVTVTNSGFTGDAEEIAKAAIDSSGGFSLVLAGVKAWLEQGVQLNLVADRHPDSLGAH